MELHPGEVSAEGIPSFEIVRQEFNKGTAELVMAEPLQVDLRRREDQDGRSTERRFAAIWTLKMFSLSFPAVQTRYSLRRLKKNGGMIHRDIKKIAWVASPEVVLFFTCQSS